MKKWSYIVVGFIFGVCVAMYGSTAFAEVQSLIGKKVTGEMNVIVNGEKLQDKGAVIEGRTNAPIRALADSLGADLKVDGSTIYINTATTGSADKETLLQEKIKLENSIKTLTEEKNKMEEKYKLEPNPGYEGAITSYQNIIEDKQVELNKVNEALKAFE